MSRGTGAWLSFTVYTPEAGGVTTNVDGASGRGENHTTVALCRGVPGRPLPVGGDNPADLAEQAGYLFMLQPTDFGDTETLLSMAEGVVLTGPSVAWEMGWVPEGYEPHVPG